MKFSLLIVLCFICTVICKTVNQTQKIETWNLRPGMVFKFKDCGIEDYEKKLNQTIYLTKIDDDENEKENSPFFVYQSLFQNGIHKLFEWRDPYQKLSFITRILRIKTKNGTIKTELMIQGLLHSDSGLYECRLENSETTRISLSKIIVEGQRIFQKDTINCTVSFINNWDWIEPVRNNWDWEKYNSNWFYCTESKNITYSHLTYERVEAKKGRYIPYKKEVVWRQGIKLDNNKSEDSQLFKEDEISCKIIVRVLTIVIVILITVLFLFSLLICYMCRFYEKSTI